jgi:phenylacetate-CoA ligase
VERSPGRLTKTWWTAYTAAHALADARLPWLPARMIDAIQRRRIRAIVRHAYETVPFYSRAMRASGLKPSDIQDASDLSKLPLISGDDLARDPAGFLSTDFANGRSLPLRSSGTSGRLRTIHYDPRALFLAMAHGHRQRMVFRRFVGRRFGYREMNASRSGSISESIRGFYESSLWVPRGVDLSRQMLPPSQPFAETVSRLNAFRPDVIMGYGSFLGGLFRRAVHEGVVLARPRLIVYGGDGMADGDRSLIEHECGVPVVSIYQAAEALHLAFQCERREAFHVNHDHVVLQIVDGQGDPVQPGGTGRIVISNLTNRATVILNYLLGDLATLGRRPCPCGRTLSTIERIEGRADDYVVLPGGERLHALSVQSSVHRIEGVIQLQIVQEELRRFLLRVVYTGRAEWSGVSREIAATLGRMVGGDAIVEVERVDALAVGPSLKVKAVISHVDG